jgi:hypothetical protein
MGGPTNLQAGRGAKLASHLHESQRAMVGAKLENMKQGRPGKDANLHGISHDDAADLLNISKRSIATARKLLDSETAEPELIEAVEPANGPDALGGNSLLR